MLFVFLCTKEPVRRTDAITIPATYNDNFAFPVKRRFQRETSSVRGNGKFVFYILFCKLFLKPVAGRNTNKWEQKIQE